MRYLLSIFIVLFPFLNVGAVDHINLKNVTVLVDEGEKPVVRTAAGHFADDVGMVCGRNPQVVSSVRTPLAVIVGTIGNSRLIQKIVSDDKMDVSAIEGRWESYKIEIISNPLPGVDKALVVVGSDARGTAYGLFSVSRKIGVHPWYWWLDIPVEFNENPVFELHSPITSKEPSVKYRGIFLNDEDYALLPWARSIMDIEYGTIGPRTYERVCELLLRLNANLLYPAMHKRTVAFYQIPENKQVAHRYGILIGTSHHEPLHFNNSSEWDEQRDGEWNYEVNSENINEALRSRVQEVFPYENIYTIALRGLGDCTMSGSDDVRQRLALIQSALGEQRKILEDITGRKAENTPQSFTPYKEVLKLYDAGLYVPDDVTIMWPDDNYGYMKRISNPQEQKRSGGSGCYYHVSYNGKPHSYMWLCTTPAGLMYEELSKVYGSGGDRIWVVNVGDLKGCELGMDQFLSMAYDWTAFSFDNAWKYPMEWLVSVLGEDHRDSVYDIMRSFYDLAFRRKPEYMGWGYDHNMERKEICTDTELSRINYAEMSSRMVEYDRISARAQKLFSAMPGKLHTAYLHTVYYPVVASSLMNKVHLLAQTARDYAFQGRNSTYKVVSDVRMWRDSLDRLTARYNAGKWDKVMSIRQFSKTAYNEMPIFFDKVCSDDSSYGVEVAGGGASGFNVLPQFNSLTDKAYEFSLYSKTDASMTVKLCSKPEWVSLTMSEDRYGDIRGNVTVDWERCPAFGDIKGEVVLDVCGTREVIHVSARKVDRNPEDVCFVEDNGVVSIDAASYTRATGSDEIEVATLENLGVEGRAVMLGTPLASPSSLDMDSPYVEYDFWTDSRGMVDVYIYVLPTFELYNALPPFEHEVQPEGTRYGVMMDGGTVINPSFSSAEYSGQWHMNVLRNCSVKKTSHYVDRPGKHTLRLICGTPGVVFQKIVIDFGGLKKSYLGPEPTRIKQVK